MCVHNTLLVICIYKFIVDTAPSVYITFYFYITSWINSWSSTTVANLWSQHRHSEAVTLIGFSFNNVKIHLLRVESKSPTVATLLRFLCCKRGIKSLVLVFTLGDMLHSTRV